MPVRHFFVFIVLHGWMVVTRSHSSKRGDEAPGIKFTVFLVFIVRHQGHTWDRYDVTFGRSGSLLSLSIRGLSRWSRPTVSLPRLPNERYWGSSRHLSLLALSIAFGGLLTSSPVSDVLVTRDLLQTATFGPFAKSWTTCWRRFTPIKRVQKDVLVKCLKYQDIWEDFRTITEGLSIVLGALLTSSPSSTNSQPSNSSSSSSSTLTRTPSGADWIHRSKVEHNREHKKKNKKKRKSATSICTYVDQ